MNKHNAELARAKALISDFCKQEYGHGCRQDDDVDFLRIGVAYTTVASDERFGIQVYVDLARFCVETCILLPSGDLPELCIAISQYNSLSDLIECELEDLDFEDLIDISEGDWEFFSSVEEGKLVLAEEYPVGSKIRWSTGIFEGVEKVIEGIPMTVLQEKMLRGTVVGMDSKGKLIITLEDGRKLHLLFGYDDFYPGANEADIQEVHQELKGA